MHMTRCACLVELFASPETPPPPLEGGVVCLQASPRDYKHSGDFRAAGQGGGLGR